VTEDRDALIERYRRSREEFLAAIEGLTEEQLLERSHNGWCVKDHMVHLAFWDELRATEVTRLSAGFESAWRLSTEADDTLNGLVTAARWDLSLAQVEWEFAESHRRLMDALVLATPEGLDPSRYGEAGLTSGHESEHAAWIREWRAERGY